MPSLDTSELAANLGDYCRDEGSVIALQAFYGLESIEQGGIKAIPNIKDEHPLISPYIGHLLQKGNTANASGKNWNPTSGATTFDARILKVRPAKMDLTINPLSQHTDFMSKRQNPRYSSKDTYRLPYFEMYFLPLIIQQIFQDTEDALWNGVYTEGATNPDGTANHLAICDGFLSVIIPAAIAANDIVPVPTGTITAANAVEKLEKMWITMPDVLKQLRPDGELQKVYMSPTVKAYYDQNYRALYGNNTGEYARSKMNKRLLEISDGLCEMIPLRAFGSSQRVIFDPMGELTFGIDDLVDFSSMTFESNRRDLDIFVDVKLGGEVASFKNTAQTLQMLVINDQT